MIHLILVLALVGFVTWLILQIPMPAVFKNIIIGIICVLVILWLCSVFGIDTGFRQLR